MYKCSEVNIQICFLCVASIDYRVYFTLKKSVKYISFKMVKIAKKIVISATNIYFFITSMLNEKYEIF